MPIEKSRLDRINDSVEKYLNDHEKEIMSYCDEDTDPKQFLDPPKRTLPVSEPPDTFQGDSAPQRIHGAGRKDLFS